MSGKHLYEQMWINAHLFFKPEIKPDLPANRFQFVQFRSEGQNEEEDLNYSKGETKEESRAIV